MAETSKKSDAASTNSLGLKAFNQTGRDDTTNKIIRPKVDPQVRTRNMMLTAVVVVGMCIALYIAFIRSGININDITREDTGGIGMGASKVKQSFDNNN